MGINTNKNSSDSGKVNLPLEPLFTLLHNNGFKVKPDDYVEMLKITERFGSEDIDETAKWICPIVATNEHEQVKFYNLIEEYKKLSIFEKEKTPVITIPLWQKILLPLIVTSVLLAIYYFSGSPDPFPVGDTNIYETVKLGDSVSLKSSNLFAGRERDTSKVEVKWNFGPTESASGLDVWHVFNQPGENIVVRQYKSKKIPLTKNSDTAFIFVCKDFPTVEINTPATPVFVDSSFNLDANITANVGTISWYQWKVNDSIITTLTPQLSNIKFSKDGTYIIECMAVVGDVNSPCSVTATQSIIVLKEGINYNARFSHFIEKTVGGQTSLKLWVHLALLVPATLGLFYCLFKRKKKKPVDIAIPPEPGRIETGTKVRQVYDVPFERTDQRLVQPEKDLRMLLLQLRMKAEEENLVLNVPGTISSIIRAGGSPQLVYAPQTRQQEYLILIDRSNPKSMMTRLFEYMVDTMIDSGIPLSSYYYDNKFLCFNKQYPLGISLKRLAEIHGNSTLIIMGKAHDLVYRAYPVIEEKLLGELNRWEQKAIITPIPSCDWDTKEKVLQEHLILLPADLMALQKLVPSIKEKVKLQKNQLENLGTKPYSTLYIDFRDVDALKAYLDNDEVLFQWICAACVYPRLRWEVLIETGKAVLEKYGQPEKLNYTTLLKICRISWMQEGVFPQSVRLELLKLLTVENELCARETLQRMLVTVSILFKGNNYAFEEERKRQQLTNEFVLHSNNKERYPQYKDSEEMFKKIWTENTILDIPLKKYLDKPAGSNYQTPVQANNITVGVPAFFNIQEKKKEESIRTNRIASAIISVFLIALWIYLAFGGGALKVQGMKLYQYKTSQTMPYQLVVRKDFTKCNKDSTGNYFDNLEIGFGLGDIDSIANGDSIYTVYRNSYDAVYDAKTGIATFSIPDSDYYNSKGHLNLSWGDENTKIILPVDFSIKSIPDSLIITCDNNSPPKPVFDTNNRTLGYKWIGIDVQSLPSSLNEIWKGQSANRLANIDLSNKRMYYSTAGKNTFGTYRLDSVFQNENGEYMITTIGGNNQYRAFKIQKITQSSFEISVCPIVISRQTMTESVNMNCGRYERMTFYYEINPSNIYLPLGAKNLVASEKNKLDQKAKSMSTPDGYKINLNNNESYAPVSAQSTTGFLKNSGIPVTVSRANGPINLAISKISPANPFSRSYLTIATEVRPTNYENNINNANNNPVQQQQVNQMPDCSVTFYSLEDVRKSPLNICKLDLSRAGLKEIPKELFECKNMQELTLGETTIPEASIRTLQEYLPKCQIRFSIIPASNIKDTTFIQARLITFKSPGEVPKLDISYIQGLTPILNQYPEARIRLVGYYKNDREKGFAQSNINVIKKYLFTGSFTPGSKQVLEQLILTDDKAQKSAAVLKSDFIFASKVEPGVNEELGDPPTTVAIFVSGFPKSPYNAAKK